MREALAPYIGQRIQITAPVQRLGTRIGWTGAKLPTLLVGPVLNADGVELADHLWLHVGRRIAAVAPQPGDVLTLTGRVRPYARRRRQYHGTTLRYDSDLGLAYPTRCAVVARAIAKVAESATFAPEAIKRQTAESAVCQPEPVEHVHHGVHDTPPTESVDRSIPVSPTLSAVPARAKVLFALAVLSLEKAEGVSLTELSARAAVPPVAFLSQLKKMGNAGIVQFTPTGRILLTSMPTQAIGVAQ